MGLAYYHPFSNDRAEVLNIQSLCYMNTYVTDTILESRLREITSSGIISEAYNN